MAIIRYVINLLQDKFTATFHHEAAVNVFCKALYVYLFLKVIFIWETSALTIQYFPIKQPDTFIRKMILFPAVFAMTHFTFFCWIFFAILLAGLFIKRNYITALLIVWFGWNFYKINLLTSNGSDYILIMLLVLTIPLSSFPRAKNDKIFFIQKVGHNAGLILCQIQIAIVYLISGLDKLQSEIWQTGDAIQFVNRLGFLSNPNLAHLLPPGDLAPFVLSWLTIIFELSFPIMVWLKEFRGFVLIAGVIFHLCIAIFISLPDFGLIMIIGYIPFITNKVLSGDKIMGQTEI